MSDFSRDISDAEFDTEVLTASHKVPVLVDFWAPWCQPCRVLKPILEKLAGEYAGRFLLIKINSDENPDAAARYGVRGIPAVKAFVAGEQVDEFSGALPESQVRAFIERILPSPASALIEAAQAARAEGELSTALALLDDARAADPANVHAWLESAEAYLAGAHVAEARATLDSVEARVRTPTDATRFAALRARVELQVAGQGGDVDALSALVAAKPDDLSARQQLANALALAGRYRDALEQFLALVQRDRQWGDEAGRKGLLNLFTLLAAQADQEALVREYRVKLSRTLN
ncbi:MAG: tetratricopeptide repeat protein [Rhodocyclaceae bacterium]|nr:tetratricopeptide repeat protein [Rhodocyclaceae bacterium]